MKNLRISFPLVDGSLFELEDIAEKELVHKVASDDWAHHLVQWFWNLQQKMAEQFQS